MAKLLYADGFQSPEGDSLFFYQVGADRGWIACKNAFQSPEGDSLFFYATAS